MTRPVRRTPRGHERPFEPGFSGAVALALARLCRHPLTALGIDQPTFRQLLLLEFVLANRRGRDSRTGARQAASTVANAFTFLLYFLFGAFAGFALGQSDDPLWGIALALSFAMVVVTLSLIADYLPGLLDTADVELLAATPVDDRAVVAARVFRAVVYIGSSVACLGFVPAIVGSVRFGIVPFLPMWILGCVLATVTCAALAFGLFLLLLRVLDVERFRDVMIWVQTVAMVIIVGGFQIAPRVISTADFEAITSGRPVWLLALPPFHAAGLISWTLGDIDRLTPWLAALAVGVPVAASLVLFRFAAGGFLARLSAMATGARSAVRPRLGRRPVRDLLLRDPRARAGYDFVVALSRREREFRMRTYPAIALSFVLGGSLIWSSHRGLDPSWAWAAMYYLGLYTPMVVMASRFSDDHEARWLFRTAPTRRAGTFLLGGFTGLMVAFFVPIVLLATLVLVVSAGPTLLPDALFAAEAILAMTALAALVFGREVPFTQKPVKAAGGSQTGALFGLMFVNFACAGVQALLRLWPPALWAGIVALPFVTWAILNGLRNVEPALPRD